LEGEVTTDQKYPFFLVSILSGSGEINGRQVKRGDHLILPSGFGEIHFQGTMEMICSTAVE
ncbi:MAG: mannose-6-phosphate isomerase, partial [Lachnospiraceae bacterium]|nr:mannose-6-phosphate isomerase [Lachnospiraceae bacterium]